MVAKKPVVLELDIKSLAKVKKHLTQASNSVDEVTVLHLLPYLKPVERINFINELYRVMKKGAKAQLITPHWCSSRAYADLRFEFPPVAEGWYFNMSAASRAQDPNGDKRYKCDFDFTIGYGLHQSLVSRNQEYQSNAVSFYKEAAQDLIATIIKK